MIPLLIFPFLGLSLLPCDLPKLLTQQSFNSRDLAEAANYFVALGDELPQKEEKEKEKSFCAGIGTATPIYQIGKGDLVISFMVFNDGKIGGDPHYKESELLVNGQPMKEFFNIIHYGINPASFQQVLKPGQSVHLTKTLTNTLAKSGIYKLVWKNPYFESPELTIRVVESK